jgi:hypothetical protein
MYVYILRTFSFVEQNIVNPKCTYTFVWFSVQTDGSEYAGTVRLRVASAEVSCVVERVLPSQGRVVIVVTCSVTQDVSNACNLGHRRHTGGGPSASRSSGYQPTSYSGSGPDLNINPKTPILSDIFRSFISWQLRGSYVKLCHENYLPYFFM